MRIRHIYKFIFVLIFLALWFPSLHKGYGREGVYLGLVFAGVLIISLYIIDFFVDYLIRESVEANASNLKQEVSSVSSNDKRCK